ncbi:MAG TPA: YggT family protein [Thermodesulfobacteriota bacterium]|nr:YggT family protein [Thermodesulfobacteriota bacterium]
MFVLANLLQAVAQILDIGLTIYMWVIIVRALISWVNPDPYNPVVRFLYQATEPVLYRIRRVIPFLGGLDVSPIVAIFAIYFIKSFFVRTILEVALKLKTGG